MQWRPSQKNLDIKVIAGGHSRYLHGQNGKVILLIHGFTGLPTEWLPLAAQLNAQGFSVVMPRLAGHATNIDDFNNTRAQDWLLQTRLLYQDWSAQGFEVIPMGLSMGGLIACWLAAVEQSRLLLMLAPAFAFFDKTIYATPLLAPWISSLANNNYLYNDGEKKATNTENVGVEQKQIAALEEQVDHLYKSRHHLKPLVQLVRLSKIVRSSLPLVKADCFLALGEQDRVIDVPRTEHILRSSLHAKRLHICKLPEAKHVLSKACYLAQLFPEVNAWLCEHGQQRSFEQ